MIPGDHLQFLYQMWLARDTFFGPTPFFSNLYEFNFGNDEERYTPGKQYYIPFSLVYSFCALGGKAFGWNGTGIVSLWLTFIFTLLLARRYTQRPWLPWLAATVSVIFPYRWHALLGGSPTGLAMMWTPAVFFGLDVMVRDKKAWGGALAGLSIYFSGWSDQHVMFFTALAAPFWCLVSYVYGSKKIFPSKDDLRRLALAAIPLILFAGLVLLQVKGTKTSLEDTELSSQARRLSEVALFSPHIEGIWDSDCRGKDSQIYLGWFMILFLILPFCAVMVKALRKSLKPGRVATVSILLFLGISGIVVLSTGVNNPAGGELTWLRLCRVLPPYGMMRQPAKIFILLPTMISVFIAVTFPFLPGFGRTAKKTEVIVCFVIGAVLLFDYGQRVYPSVCRLDNSQGAYRAVAEKARSAGRAPRAMGIPLWPGDSHWSSLNQYYSSLYRIRMVNGYRPTPKNSYIRNVYDRFESFNQGSFSDDQLDELLSKDINCLLLHENAFPEKVSPFPVAYTLHHMLRHPRLSFLARDGAVWAFEIKPEAVPMEEPPDWNTFFPSRLWQGENSKSTNSTVIRSPHTSANAYIHLRGPDSSVNTHTYPITYEQGLKYLVRLKGQGPAAIQIVSGSNVLKYVSVDTDPETWKWTSISIPPFDGYKKTCLQIRPENGAVNMDLAILAFGEWDCARFDSIELPAPLFYHSGYTDIETGHVVLRPEYEAADAIFYGPKLPVPPGKYLVELNFKTDAPDGTILGELQSRYPYGRIEPIQITAGEKARTFYDQPNNLRMALNFVYSRKADISIKSLRITRTGDIK